ncbi:hypothetical protein QJQ45_020360 [Haematococcus lacustris]|nr:hypothetical protein QJQ45_020360 [Haematococcus lacustris]
MVAKSEPRSWAEDVGTYRQQVGSQALSTVLDASYQKTPTIGRTTLCPFLAKTHPLFSQNDFVDGHAPTQQDQQTQSLRWKRHGWGDLSLLREEGTAPPRGRASGKAVQSAPAGGRKGLTGLLQQTDISGDDSWVGNPLIKPNKGRRALEAPKGTRTHSLFDVLSGQQQGATPSDDSWLGNPLIQPTMGKAHAPGPEQIRGRRDLTATIQHTILLEPPIGSQQPRGSDPLEDAWCGHPLIQPHKGKAPGPAETADPDLLRGAAFRDTVPPGWSDLRRPHTKAVPPPVEDSARGVLDGTASVSVADTQRGKKYIPVAKGVATVPHTDLYAHLTYRPLDEVESRAYAHAFDDQRPTGRKAPAVVPGSQGIGKGREMLAWRPDEAAGLLSSFLVLSDSSEKGGPVWRLLSPGLRSIVILDPNLRMTSVEEEVAGSEPSLSLIDDLALLVINHLALDERALGRLSTVSKFWRTACSDPRLWPTPATRRFGHAALRLEVTVSPDHLKGWTFVQGMRPHGKLWERLKHLPVAELAAAAADRGALAFHTEGDMFLSLNHPNEWQHTSFHPQTGTYVRHTWTHLPELLPDGPASPPAGQCPPQLPGWTFLPGLDLAQTRALPCLVKDFRSLKALGRHCFKSKKVVAFNTKGHVAEMSAVQWSPTLEAWHGVYVWDSLLMEGSLPPVPTWQQRIRRWARLRQAVVDPWQTSTLAGGAGLGRDRLKRVRHAGSLAPEVALLQYVDWLALDAQWPEVGPGDYLLAWRVQWIETPSFSLEADLQLKATRVPGKEATSNLPLISRQKMSSLAGQAIEGLPLYRCYSLKELWKLARSAKYSGWVGLEVCTCMFQVGKVHVPPSQRCTLYARLWNISDKSKSGMVFDVVELKRVKREA